MPIAELVWFVNYALYIQEHDWLEVEVTLNLCAVRIRVDGDDKVLEAHFRYFVDWRLRIGAFMIIQDDWFIIQLSTSLMKSSVVHALKMKEMEKKM